MTTTDPGHDASQDHPRACASAPDTSGTSPDPCPVPSDPLGPLAPPVPPTGPQQWEGLLPRQLRR